MKKILKFFEIEQCGGDKSWAHFYKIKWFKTISTPNLFSQSNIQKRKSHSDKLILIFEIDK
jgi:hypothetical protein